MDKITCNCLSHFLTVFLLLAAKHLLLSMMEGGREYWTNNAVEYSRSAQNHLAHLGNGKEFDISAHKVQECISFIFCRKNRAHPSYFKQETNALKVSAAAAAAKSLQLCPTLCNPIDGRPLGFPVPGILQARTLEWVSISFSNA